MASPRAHPFWSLLAWVVMSLTIVTTIAALLLESATGGLEGTLLEDLALAAAFMAFAVVGALIASRHPTNAAGIRPCGDRIDVGGGRALPARPECAFRVSSTAALPAQADAARVIELFSAGLREEVDLDHVQVNLLSVVRDTMQPEHASLWLRSEAE